MSVKAITLTVQQDDVRKVESRGDAALAEGACPKCKATPFMIAGGGQRIEGHDTYAADGACLSCRKPIGVIRAKVSTLFGLEEDERVLYHGRARVY